MFSILTPFRKCRQHLFRVLYVQQFGFSPLCIIFSCTNYTSEKKRKKKEFSYYSSQEAQIQSLFFHSMESIAPITVMTKFITWCVEKTHMRAHTQTPYRCTTHWPCIFAYKGKSSRKSFLTVWQCYMLQLCEILSYLGEFTARRWYYW